MEPNRASYALRDISHQGTIHHAAEIGSVAAMKQVQQRELELWGLPAVVVLEQRDNLLQCVPLHVAAERGHLDVIKYIASHDIDLDTADGHQVRPLHLAAINNHCDVVKTLLDKGANLTKQDSEGDLPLLWAATKGHLQVLELLLERGSPVDAHNKAGWTALHRAAYNGRVEACVLLLRRGASIHAITKTGSTALHLAAANNHLGVMELLLRLGATTHMKDLQGAAPAGCCISDAARGLIEEKEAALCQPSSGRSSSAQAGAHSRPGSKARATSGSAAAATADITRVPHMPRYKPAANTNLDADGFPTTEAHISAGGLVQEAQDTDDEDPVQMLLVDAEQQAVGSDMDDGDGSMLSSDQHRVLSTSIGGSSLSGRPGQLSQQSSRQQCSPGVTKSGSFKAGINHSTSGGPDDKQLRPWLSGKQRQAGPMQRFLKQYSLDKKGLFAP